MARKLAYQSGKISFCNFPNISTKGEAEFMFLTRQKSFVQLLRKDIIGKSDGSISIPAHLNRPKISIYKIV
jgi:hypothetical protein